MRGKSEAKSVDICQNPKRHVPHVSLLVCYCDWCNGIFTMHHFASRLTDRYLVIAIFFEMLGVPVRVF